MARLKCLTLALTTSAIFLPRPKRETHIGNVIGREDFQNHLERAGDSMYGKILSPEEIKSREKEYLNLKSKGPDDLESLNRRKKILA